MKWKQWVDSLEVLVGIGAAESKVRVLMPAQGKSDLSLQEGKELAHAIYSRLFPPSPKSITKILHDLYREPTRNSLPLLYYSAWLARQQEDAHEFWPPFHKEVIKDGLTLDQTRQLAPLITMLWQKMHNQIGIYRPAEGRRHIKWPQAHAGLTDGEINLLLKLVAKQYGCSDEPPDILYNEPDDLLRDLRVWCASGAHLPTRLRRLINGPDAVALVTAELAQRRLAESWPPDETEFAPEQRQMGQRAYLRIGLRPLDLRAVLCEGRVEGYQTLQAVFGNDKVNLETIYSSNEDVTRHKSYEWRITSIPWPTQIQLIGDAKIPIWLTSECPFDPRGRGAMLFDPDTSLHRKRWHPNRQYLLLTQETNSLPNWVDDLFDDLECIDKGNIGENRFAVFSVVGRDIGNELDNKEITEFLGELEQKLETSKAIISLPDIDSLLEPDVMLCGGLLVSSGQCPIYLETGEPYVLVRSTPGGGTHLRLNVRADDGSEKCLLQQLLTADGGEPVVVQLPTLCPGLYVIRGRHEPIFFRLEPRPDYCALQSMKLNMKLIQSNLAIVHDDIRHFEDKGIEFHGWPKARITLKVKTEAGSRVYPPFNLEDDGRRIIRAQDIDLPDKTRWVKIEATAWLANSDPLNLTLRPYISKEEVSLCSGQFLANVRGVEKGTHFVFMALPDRPWKSPIVTYDGIVDEYSRISVNMTANSSDGWIIVSDEKTHIPWLIMPIGSPDIKFRQADFLAAYRNESLELPSYLKEFGPFQVKIGALCCIIMTAQLAWQGLISYRNPVPEYLKQILLRDPNALSVITITLPMSLRRKKARIQFVDKTYSRALLLMGEEQLGVSVRRADSTIKVTWDSGSRPCYDMGFRDILTQGEWRRRYPSLQPSAMRYVESDFQIDMSDELHWINVINLIENIFLKALNDQSSQLPQEFKQAWEHLQAAHRNRQSSLKEMPPERWIKGSFAAWRELYYLLNSDWNDKDWVQIWNSIELYRNSILAFTDL